MWLNIAFEHHINAKSAAHKATKEESLSKPSKVRYWKQICDDINSDKLVTQKLGSGHGF